MKCKWHDQNIFELRHRFSDDHRTIKCDHDDANNRPTRANHVNEVHSQLIGCWDSIRRWRIVFENVCVCKVENVEKESV